MQSAKTSLLSRGRHCLTPAGIFPTVFDSPGFRVNAANTSWVHTSGSGRS
ncbi:hypothetical protein LE190_13435 [Massilia oculi]|uniref:Uncharacterized protein n=1 Tax=Massilia hydrophila TaxID=3044279 RepID=A0ABS7YB41_9BURK|nr:hypothetical protein [Massilia oculi]MCA1856922.1 hypothetical protein [Massilia oculi]